MTSEKQAKKLFCRFVTKNLYVIFTYSGLEISLLNMDSYIFNEQSLQIWVAYFQCHSIYIQQE